MTATQTAPLVSTSNPVLVKFRSIPTDSRSAWALGFLERFGEVYFANWSDAEANPAATVVRRWLRVYGR